MIRQDSLIRTETTFFSKIGWSSRHGFTKRALEYLLTLGETQDYGGVLITILSEVRDPITIPYVVRRVAQRDSDARQKGNFSPFVAWPDNWRRWRDQGEISRDCVDALRNIWSDRGEPEWLRSYALKVWNQAAGELDDLRSIAPTDPLFQSALRFRMLLGDRDVTADVVGLLKTKPWWMEQIPRIWSDQLEAVVTRCIEQHLAAPPANVWSNEDFRLAHVLRDIPPAIGENFLIRYWDKARTRPLFVQAALYLSTEQTRSLAADALPQLGSDAFNYVDDFFGLRTSGLVDRLTMAHLESLRPHLLLLSNTTIAHMIEFCGRYGYLVLARIQMPAHVLRPERHHSEVSPATRSGCRAILG